MKIIFVGIHNKPYKTPLDSTTLSGKTIDAIIERFPEDVCVKMNLFDVYYMPVQPEEQATLVQDFLNRAELTEKDLVVLLGSDVQKHLAVKLMSKHIPMVFAAHPSLRFNKTKRPDYIDQVEAKINAKIIKNAFFTMFDLKTANGSTRKIKE